MALYACFRLSASAPGMASRRGDQAVEQVGVLDDVAAAERLDDVLDVTAAFAGVLHEVEVFVRSDLLDADEHGAIPDPHGPPRRIDECQALWRIFIAPNRAY
jgi:hypothetical protein